MSINSFPNIHISFATHQYIWYRKIVSNEENISYELAIWFKIVKSRSDLNLEYAISINAHPFYFSKETNFLT